MRERLQKESNMSKTNYMRYTSESLHFFKVDYRRKDVYVISFRMNPQPFLKACITKNNSL